MIKRIVCWIFVLLSSLQLSAQDKTYHGDGIDTYLEYSPWLAVYALKALSVESASSWKRLLVNSALSYVVAAGSVQFLKTTIHERRPDGTNNRSFPSGHAAISFAGANVLHHEYGKLSPWISVGGFAAATFVSVDRVVRNRHHWYDVAAGAAIGYLSTELGYRLGDLITGERSRYDISVSPQGLSMAVRF